MIGFGQQTYVPDVNFENYLENNGMGNGIWNDDSVYTVNINTVDTLMVFSQNISDLTGIEDFTALTTLGCWDNQLTSLDVSANTALTTLWCLLNQLTSLDVSGATALTTLWCWDNQLTSLDVSQNTALTSLGGNNNQLTTLDVSGATSLFNLHCYSNQLTSLDVSNNTALTEFQCHNNQLTSLDVSGATALTTLWCLNNQLTSLDVSQNTALTTLFCFNNQLTSLDVSQNTALTEFQCHNNQLTSLDVSGATALTTLYCDNNPNLYCIDVDDPIWSTTNWTVANGNIDSTMSFSINCAIAFGCLDPLACNYDSIATISDSSCNYPTSNNTTQTSCDSYTWSVDGTTYTTSGTYTYLTTNAAGCDSVVTLDLTVNYSTTSTDNQVACGSYTWDGAAYTASGAYTNTYTNVAGCDSVHTLGLTILPIPISNIYQNNSNLSVIPNSGLGPYTYMWSTMETTQSITPASFGTYWAFITAQNGCNSDTLFYNYTSTAISENNTTKKLLSIVNNLGQETPFRRSTPLFYIYDDGTVEKRIVIE